jgi:hypothetical protein
LKEKSTMANHSFLASDDQNPDFVGAHNPDNRLHARFYKHAVQNNFRTEQEGRPIYDDIDMIEVQVPGDKLTSVHSIVREDHKRRFPQQWAHFHNQHEGDQALAGKTPLEHWPRLTRAQVAELRHLHFRSVEDIAHASDTQLQSLGMCAGMSSYKFRDVAQQFLKLAGDESAASKADARANQLEKEMAELRAQMAAMASANQPVTGFAQLAGENAPQEDGAAPVASRQRKTNP